VRPTTSTGPINVGACSRRARAAATTAAGRIMVGGNVVRTANSSVARDARRGWFAASACRSMPARHALPIVFHRRSDHARERFETIELAEGQCGQCLLHSLAQGLIIDRKREAAGESSRQLLKRENVQSMLLLTRCGKAPLAHCMTTIGDYSVTVQSPLLRCKTMSIATAPPSCSRTPDTMASS